MSQWIGHTNRKLYQCRLLLAQRAHSFEPAALQQALEEAALSQLQDAWQCYVQELAESVSLRTTVHSLAELMAQAPLVTGEMRELAQLLDDSFSWLSQMLNAAKAAHWPQPLVVKKHSIEPDVSGDLALIALSEEASLPIEQWWQQLSQLIDGQRSHRHES